MEININAEDLKLIRKFEDILCRGYYADGKQVTDLHNKVLGTRLASTNCSSCIRSRIQALVDAANKFERLSQRMSEKASESVPEVKVEDTPQEENKSVRSKKKK